MRIDVCNGKYTVIVGYGGELSCLRYGEEWRDCVGDNLIYNLAVELSGMREKLQKPLMNKDTELKLLEKIREILIEGYQSWDDAETPFIYLDEIKEILNGEN